MITEEQTQRLRKAVKELAEDPILKEFVSYTENSWPETENHYGKYMTLLGQAKDASMREILRYALLMAGANREGVESAMQIVGGEA